MSGGQKWCLNYFIEEKCMRWWGGWFWYNTIAKAIHVGTLKLMPQFLQRLQCRCWAHLFPTQETLFAFHLDLKPQITEPTKLPLLAREFYPSFGSFTTPLTLRNKDWIRLHGLLNHVLRLHLWRDRFILIYIISMSEVITGVVYYWWRSSELSSRQKQCKTAGVA